MVDLRAVMIPRTGSWRQARWEEKNSSGSHVFSKRKEIELDEEEEGGGGKKDTCFEYSKFHEYFP